MLRCLNHTLSALHVLQLMHMLYEHARDRTQSWLSFTLYFISYSHAHYMHTHKRLRKRTACIWCRQTEISEKRRKEGEEGQKGGGAEGERERRMKEDERRERRAKRIRGERCGLCVRPSVHALRQQASKRGV
eukprot:5639092-Pleurochrysis_carterae.AAC.1